MEDVYCFGGNPLDRASERRDDGGWIATLLDDPETRLLALRDLKPFTRGTAVPALDWQPVTPWREQIDAGAPLIFLGLGDGRAHFAIDAAGAKVAPDVDTELIDVRALAPTIAPGEAAILAEARSLLDWHADIILAARIRSPTSDCLHRCRSDSPANSLRLPNSSVVYVRALPMAHTPWPRSTGLSDYRLPRAASEAIAATISSGSTGLPTCA
jgi:hypothetical protein